MKNRGVFLFACFLVVMIGVSTYFRYTLRSSAEMVLSEAESQMDGISEEVLKSKMPFVEMTVPYLRSRKYESALGALKRVSDKATYTSYTTNYDSDGFLVNGLLTIPKGKTPDGGHPAVVFVHGYVPPTLYRTLEKYSDYVDYLARNGFVVFKIDLRGHGTSEGEANGGYYSSDYVIDTLNARAALMASNFVNDKKIGLWGHSMAGNVLLRSLVSQTDIPAVVIWAGAGFTYTDLLTYRISDGSYRPPELTSLRAKRRQELREAHGDFSPNNEFWKEVAPTQYLGEIKGAIQLHHAINDTVVSVEYSRNLSKILSSTDVSHELYEYKTGGHNINSPSFETAMARTVEFFKREMK